jgi:hypothetical protein
MISVGKNAIYEIFYNAEAPSHFLRNMIFKVQILY